jgi:hypothetical protein
MEYFKLIFGIALLVFFVWLTISRHRRTKSFIDSILNFDIILGIIAGLYLVISSVGTILT